jgi:hypothetical protein
MILLRDVLLTEAPSPKNMLKKIKDFLTGANVSDADAAAAGKRANRRVQRFSANWDAAGEEAKEMGRDIKQSLTPRKKTPAVKKSGRQTKTSTSNQFAEYKGKVWGTYSGFAGMNKRGNIAYFKNREAAVRYSQGPKTK